MEYFFDDLSKRIATAASRRDMLSITARTCFAAFLSSTGIGKLWASSTKALSSSQVCPGCGTCRQCNTKAGKCDEDCEDRCTAALLCLIAQQFPPYVTLQAFLATQFTSASNPDALVLIEPGVKHAKVLSTTYSGTDPSATAKLYFTETTGGFNAYAVTFSNGAPKFGYFVAANGQLQQALPPYQLSTAAVGTSTSTGVTEGIPGTSVSQAVAPARRRRPVATACKEGCNLICGAIIADLCTDIVGASCTSTIVFGPEAPLLCFLLSATLCSVGSDPLCTKLCEGATCSCQPGSQPCGLSCCGTCESCTNGACMPISCPSGYSCSSITGTCTCNNLCGPTCCSSGQTCSNGTCVTSCPAGTTVCGTACCAAGETCQNGACTSSCGPGLAPCGPGGRCCGVCCENGTATPFCGDPGETCCGTIGLCPPSWVCCGTGANASCGPPGAICCTSRAGTTFVCNPGQVCCGDTCAAVCCATNVNGADFGCNSSGQSCCGSGANTICCGSGPGCCATTSTGIPFCNC